MTIKMLYFLHLVCTFEYIMTYFKIKQLQSSSWTFCVDFFLQLLANNSKLIFLAALEVEV